MVPVMNPAALLSSILSYLHLRKTVQNCGEYEIQKSMDTPPNKLKEIF